MGPGSFFPRGNAGAQKIIVFTLGHRVSCTVSHSFPSSNLTHAIQKGQQKKESNRPTHLGMSENVVYPKKPNGFADHYPYEKWLAIIGNINPTFSGPHPFGKFIAVPWC